MKHAAHMYTDAAIRGDYKTIDQMELYQSMTALEQDLADCINYANTRTDEDIGDWGNTKQSVNIFEDTPLIAAIRLSDFKAVHALLRSGLCDPTLQICPNEYISDRYTMYDSDKKDALVVSIKIRSDLLAKYEKSSAEHQATEIVKRIQDATKIVSLVKVTSEMWPKAKYCSPKCNGYDKTKDRAKHTNRMHGVKENWKSQVESVDLLRRKLASAVKNCDLDGINEAS